MNRNQIQDKYAIFFEDKHFVQRTDEEKLDRIDRLKGRLISKAARMSEERNKAGAQRALNQVGKLVRYGTKSLKAKLFKVKLSGRFKYETNVNAESREEAIDRAFREASVASKGVYVL